MAKDKALKAAYQKQWLAANPNYHKEWTRNNRDKHAAKLRKHRYGVTQERYEQMLETQNHRCAICTKHKSEQARALSVDHCHKTGQVRGLLCDLCNRALGYFRDSEEALLNGAAYIRKHHGAK